MALKKLIDKESVEEIPEDIEKARQEFIRGGGKVKADLDRKEVKEVKEEWERIMLRIKKEKITMIDEIVKNTMGLTRTGWILQAIEEKLKNSEI